VGWRGNAHEITEEGEVFKDDNVTVQAFRTEHGDLKYTWAYRFTTPDRVVAFGGDGHYSPGLVKAAKDADILFIEGCTKDNLKYAPWGGKTLAEKEKTIFSYHMSPQDMVRVKNESGVKAIVMIHEQVFGPPGRDFDREGLLKEMKRAGAGPNIYSSIDGDIY
jgi:ribonuclease BN (tRNA processing enzyme)